MIQVNGVKKSFGTNVLFEDAQFTMNFKDRIALIGRNGHGKSTLFNILTGEETIDEGDIQYPKNYTIGKLTQHIDFSKDNVLDEVFYSHGHLEEYELYIAEKILFGLGFSYEQTQMAPTELSSGFQLRCELAKTLIKSPQLLLLDEPTNYLDIVSTRWLVNYLNQYDGEVIAISHDRHFLDNISTHTMLIHRGGLKKIKGSINNLLDMVSQEEEIYEKTRMNQQKKRKEVEKFIERFRAKASKAKQVQSRVKSLSKQEVLEKKSALKDMGLYFEFPAINSKNFISVKNLSFGYDELLIKDLSFEIKRNARIGVIGKNGKGKSTLLNLIQEKLDHKNAIVYNSQLKVSYFGQEEIKALYPSHTIVDEIRLANPQVSQSRIRAICGAMLFDGELAEKKVGVLSGGERARVVLGKIMARPGHLLLLDEPTNHLDVESIEVLLHCIDSFDGACVIVSHDEDFIARSVDQLIVFDGEYPYKFEGDYQRFLEKVGWQDETGEGGKQSKKKSKKEQTHERQQIIKEKSKLLNPLKKEQEKLEKKCEALDNSINGVNASLLELSQQDQSGEEIVTLSKKLATLETDYGQVLENLETCLEKIANYEKEFQEKLDKV